MKLRRILGALVLMAGLAVSGRAAPVQNIIWVIGDGMGPEVMGFWMQGARQGRLSGYPEGISQLEKLLNQGFSGLFFNHTYDTIVTDSAAAATQMATGKLSRPLYIGLDAARQPAETLLEAARKHGKAIGIISDAYVTDATPAAFTAHVENRRDRKEIARQQLALAPEVILGGGAKYFGRKLQAQARQQGYQQVHTKKQLARIKSGKVLGLFAEKGMPMAVEMAQHPHVPTLTEMTQKAVELLEKDEDGFVLMVEAGKIDWAAHANDPGALLAEMKALDSTLGYLKDYADAHPGTLLYVNADHDTGLGGFVYQHIGAEKAARRSQQGEVLYGGDTDYASFNTYPQFEKQTRSLYAVYQELKALSPAQRTLPTVQEKLSQALGYPIDVQQLGGAEDLENLFKQLNASRGLAFATQYHSAAPIISVAYGAGAAAFTGVYHNTDIFARMSRALGWPAL